MQSQYENDKRFEEMIGDFLDEYFYKRLFPEDKKVVTRITNKVLQKKGIDVAVTNKENKKATNVDEKCAAHYVNTKLDTFAFEIIYKDGTIGWLIDENIVTDYYLLIWVHADEEKFPPKKYGSNNYYKTVQFDDIRYLTCCFIEKNRLIGYLEEKGLDKNSLHKQANEMRMKKMSMSYKCGLKFTYSFSDIAEAPINVLIPKNVLQTLATNELGCYCYKVDKNQIERPIDLIKETLLKG